MDVLSTWKQSISSGCESGEGTEGSYAGHVWRSMCAGGRLEEEETLTILPETKPPNVNIYITDVSYN